jgi:hypothetical protein
MVVRECDVLRKAKEEKLGLVVLVIENGVPSDIVSLFGARTVDIKSLDFLEVVFRCMKPVVTHRGH